MRTRIFHEFKVAPNPFLVVPRPHKKANILIQANTIQDITQLPEATTSRKYSSIRKRERITGQRGKEGQLAKEEEED